MRKIAINLFVVAILSHWSILAKSSEPLLYSDTLDIHHIFDGHVYEWPESSFSTDKETSIKYAIHNDNEFLFIALIAKEMGSQMKMSKFGMNLYIDTKGKKKESNGLEFPIKSGLTFSNTRAEEKPTGLISEKERITRLRESMLNSLMFMNIFGFSNTGPEPVSQALKLENKINIAFSWDSLNALIIEYRIPLSVIEESGSLNKKLLASDGN
ncbi:MAG: hypothetical protein IPI78_16565 [Chitinophagaceae bacterium]|nr:hypothetical protein [Chitinophagaceae bacterium]